MATGTRTPKSLRAEARRIERKKIGASERKQPRLYTFSHMVMGGIMLTFFVGVGIGGYVTLFRGEPLHVTLDYIMQLSRIVALGYFIKAFGENIAKIVLSAIFGNRLPDSGANNNEGGTQG